MFPLWIYALTPLITLQLLSKHSICHLLRYPSHLEMLMYVLYIPLSSACNQQLATT